MAEGTLIPHTDSDEVNPTHRENKKKKQPSDPPRAKQDDFSAPVASAPRGQRRAGAPMWAAHQRCGASREKGRQS